MSKKDDPNKAKTGRDLVDYACSHGGAVTRQTGSHCMVTGPNGGTCPVPIHNKDLPVGTKRSILKMFIRLGLIAGGLFLLIAFLPILF